MASVAHLRLVVAGCTLEAGLQLGSKGELATATSPRRWSKWVRVVREL
jgi:hypothetical protein